MQTDMHSHDAASYAAKIKQLLDSTDRRTLALAFQLIQSLGKPDLPGFSKLVSNGGLKIAFCLRYGLAEHLQHLDAIYLIDEPLEALPPEIGQLRQLEEMEIRRAGIRHLPRQLAFLKKAPAAQPGRKCTERFSFGGDVSFRASQPGYEPKPAQGGARQCGFFN
ncbi:MAG: hypothetical protein HC913_20400 [Microscillaceae bacterium]|nr:hypothetical protein [Microscillaceae bacterium]